jgi:shikimate kinase
MGSARLWSANSRARLLGYLVDSDHEIERTTGADIPLIFEIEGEAGFRRREREMIAELVGRQGIVLATGGGAVLNERSRELLHANGWVVYLQTSPAQQAERAARNRQRPLLHGHDPQQRLAELMTIREPLIAPLPTSLSPPTASVCRRSEAIIAAYQRAHAEARPRQLARHRPMTDTDRAAQRPLTPDRGGGYSAHTACCAST